MNFRTHDLGVSRGDGHRGLKACSEAALLLNFEEVHRHGSTRMIVVASDIGGQSLSGAEMQVACAGLATEHGGGSIGLSEGLDELLRLTFRTCVTTHPLHLIGVGGSSTTAKPPLAALAHGTQAYWRPPWHSWHQEDPTCWQR